jgi:hypothetical protein
MCCLKPFSGLAHYRRLDVIRLVSIQLGRTHSNVVSLSCDLSFIQITSGVIKKSNVEVDVLIFKVFLYQSFSSL